jgi:uncharacterized protein YbjT (DUF2867 family)
MKTTNENKSTFTQTSAPIAVLGATGKTGRRVVERLQTRGYAVRSGSRSASPAFDWKKPEQWDAILAGASAIYAAYHPDLAAPGATEAITHLVERARYHGIGRIVLLSGRGEEEAQRCERIVQESGMGYTIVRCSWFNQNFSENFIRDMVLGGTIALPVGDVREPFIDAEDIAAVATAALIEDGHDGELYEITGPELLTFAEATREIAEVIGRPVHFAPITQTDFIEGLRAASLPEEMVNLLDYLFTQVLDGRNAFLGDGVQRALGREPRSFAEFVREAHAQAAWGI